MPGGSPEGGYNLGPIGHTAASVGIGAAVWAATGEPLALPAAFVAGALNDADHLLDYYLWFVRKDRRRVFLVFHAWEYAVVGLTLSLTIWQHPALLAAALGHLGHMLGDQLANRPKSKLAYSIIYRMRRGFDRRRLVGEVPATMSQALDPNIPMWRLIERRLPRRIAELFEVDR